MARTSARRRASQPRQTLLIFDLDNTLVHSRIDFLGIRRDVIALLHQSGATDEPADLLRRWAIPELIRLAERHERRAAADQPQANGLVARCWEAVLRHERIGMAEATIEEDAPATLDQLRRRGYRLAVLTNNARPACVAALRRFRLERYFELLLTRDDVAALKPEGDGVRQARQHFGVDIGRVYLVGDSYVDGLAALRGGADFVAFRPNQADLAARGVAVHLAIQRLGDLVDLGLG